MFDRVAPRYDLANDVLSLGQDRAWRRLVVDAVQPSRGERILDIAAGTGTSSAPFAEAGAFVDAVTMTFGLRNVEDPAAALTEMARVTRPGGRLVICEFSMPTWRPFARLYGSYLVAALPKIAAVVSSNPAAYEYLAESIQAWPDQQGLADLIRAAGWRDVAWRNVSGGIVALHRAGI